jgi:hypothetical protein
VGTQGIFSEGVQVPGNIRIELFRGETASGTPIRTLESQVDDETGVTPESAIEQNYPDGVAHNLDKAPDLVNDPGGFYYPGNKVLVTEDYYGGIILGGATKDFDTDYTDAAGNQLQDLTEGVYTLKVTGLSGDIASYSETFRCTLNRYVSYSAASNPRIIGTNSLPMQKNMHTGSSMTPFPDTFPPSAGITPI